MKRFIALLIALLVVVTMFTACSKTISSEKPKEVQETDDVVGSYHLFYTMESKTYLNFLETFDETKYEIVDISHSHSFWYVTYRDIEE